MLILGRVGFDATISGAGPPLLADGHPMVDGRGFRSGPIDDGKPAPSLPGTGLEAPAVAALYGYFPTKVRKVPRPLVQAQ
jgi:hypothetical protein